MSLPNAFPITHLASALAGRYGTSPSYVKLITMARDGRLRTQVVNGRYFILEADVPVIAADLGLVPAASTHRAAVEHA